jgi:hypothetical protein
MNNEYFNIDGIGNAGTYVSPSSGKTFTSREQTYLLGRSQVIYIVMYVFIIYLLIDVCINQPYTILFQAKFYNNYGIILFQTYFIISNYF